MELLISLLIIVNVIDNNRMGFSWLRRDVAVVCETEVWKERVNV